MSNISEKLVSLIRPIVKQEIKALSKILAPLIESEVEKKVNKILAEQFVRGMASGNQSSLGGVFNETLKQSPVTPVKKGEDAEKQKQLIRERFQEKMKNLNIPQEDYHLFEGLPSGRISAPGKGCGSIEDDDDEGVDLSKLGL